jgi:hypothetical protein
MPVIVPQRRVWTRQPPSETGGSQGVLFAFNPAVWAKEQIVGTALTQRHGSLFAYKRAKTHLCADLTAHAAAGLLASNLGHRAGVHFCTPSTFVFAIRPTTADGCFFSRYAAAATTSGYAGAFKIGRSGTSVVVNYNDGSGAMQTWTIAANVVSDKDTVIAIDVQRDKLVCYKDGKYVAETAWTMPELGAFLVPNLPLTIGGEGNGVHSGFKGYVYGIGVVTDGEPRSLSENPWQIFKPRRRVTYIDLGAGSTYNLTIAEASHSHAVDSLLFSSQDLLTVSDASHGQTADNLGLSTQWLLAVQDALHSQASDNLTLSTTGSNSLDVQEATHAHFAEQMALVTTWLLTIAEASHGHAADNVMLDTSNATWLTVQDAGHAQSSDYLALSLDTWLAIVDAAHAHYADSPLLTAETTLAIAEALHAVYSDTVALSLPGATSLTPDDIANIASAVLDALQADPSTLTVAKFLGLK